VSLLFIRLPWQLRARLCRRIPTNPLPRRFLVPPVMTYLTNNAVGRLDRCRRCSRGALLARSRAGLARVFSGRARLASAAIFEAGPGRAGGARKTFRAPGGTVVAPWADHALAGLLEGGVRAGLAIVTVAGGGVNLAVRSDLARDALRGGEAGVEARGTGQALHRPLRAVCAW